MAAIRILGESQVRSLIAPAEALEAVRTAFVQLYRGEVTVPNVLELRLPHNHGEAHGKGAYVHGSAYFAIKVATGFVGNRLRGLPEASGLSVVFDSDTGFAELVLFDNGYLTQLRTGAAGALAADLLAREDSHSVAIIGAGAQARVQLESLLLVRPIDRVLVVSRTPASAQRYAEEMGTEHGVDVSVADSIEQAVRASDIVVTTTPAEQPIIDADWVNPGTHVTAVGSDFPDKQELDVELLARAVAVADELRPDKHEGEIYHALERGVLAEAGVQTLGGIEVGDDPGRTHEEQVTVADLTGVGVQDAAVAAIVASRASDGAVGLLFDTEAQG